MFNSPLKPVVIPNKKQHQRRREQHPALKRLFPSINDNHLDFSNHQLRIDSFNKYQNSSGKNSLINTLMFNKFILNGSTSKQLSTQTLHQRYPQICLNHLVESRIVNQLSRISQMRQSHESSIMMIGELSPRTPKSASTCIGKKKKKENHLQSRMFQYKTSGNLTTMKFIPRNWNGNYQFSNQILLGGDVDGQIQIYKIEDDYNSFVNFSSTKFLSPPPTLFSLPSRSFINRICATSSGECYIASDDSTLYSCDLSQMSNSQIPKFMTFNEHVNYITDVKANWRESLIASSSLDKTLKIWSNQMSRPVYSINLKEFVHSCCWMSRSDFSLFTSSSKDSIITNQPCSIKWWDLRKLSSYVSEIIQTDNYVDFKSDLAYCLEDDDNNSQYSSNSLFGSWSNSQKQSFPKQQPEFCFGNQQSSENSYFDSKLQRYVEPFISHCKPEEKIFDLHCIENSRNEPILISTSQLGSKLWNLNGNPVGVSSLIHKYSSSTCMDTHIIPAFYGNDTMLTGCKEGSLYMWNSIHSIENSNKKTNYSHKFEKIHPSSIRSIAISDTLFASSDQLGNLCIVSLCDDTWSGEDGDFETSSGNTLFDDLSLNSSFDSSSTSLIFDSIFDIIERTRSSQTELENLLSNNNITSNSTSTSGSSHLETANDLLSTPTKKKKKRKSSTPTTSSSKKKKK